MLTTQTVLIFIFCLAASSICAYFLGRQDGVEASLDFLIEEGIIELDDED